jgi:hypothetical protein
MNKFIPREVRVITFFAPLSRLLIVLCHAVRSLADRQLLTISCSASRAGTPASSNSANAFRVSVSGIRKLTAFRRRIRVGWH